MPRKRKPKPPITVTARMETPVPPEARGLGTPWWVACGHCGQFLIAFKVFLITHRHDGPIFGWTALPVQNPAQPHRTDEGHAGWIVQDGVVTPSAEHLRRRRAAATAVAQGTATPDDRQRLLEGRFHRSNPRPKPLSKQGVGGPSRLDYRLPVEWTCDRCAAINIVDGRPVATRRAAE